MKDVYVTDHKKVGRKYITLSKEEDMEFWRYEKKMEEYRREKKMEGLKFKEE
jgi:hypothetical protein